MYVEISMRKFLNTCAMTWWTSSGLIKSCAMIQISVSKSEVWLNWRVIAFEGK